ncbi:ATPase [Aureococcus anophagefferens]|nr:ATPase [Aureococcus anophagefferens]
MVNLKALVAGAAGLVGNLLPPRGEAGRLRRALKAKDLNETYRAELSAELAVVLFACAPGENVTARAFAEGRKHAELAMAGDPESWAAFRAERALHLALGDAEESLPAEPGPRPRRGPRARLTEHARAMLVAACSNACAARYLEMKPEEQSRGMETAPAARRARGGAALAPGYNGSRGDATPGPAGLVKTGPGLADGDGGDVGSGRAGPRRWRRSTGGLGGETAGRARSSRAHPRGRTRRRLAPRRRPGEIEALRLRTGTSGTREGAWPAHDVFGALTQVAARETSPPFDPLSATAPAHGRRGS